MRALTIGICSLALVAMSGVASADKLDASLDDKVDVSAYHQHMVVLHDGKGHYVITVPHNDHYSTIFYGDGKIFYEQRVFGGGLDTAAQSYSAKFWSPRVDNYAFVEQEAGQWKVQCSKRITPLKQLPDKEAKAMIAAAVFRTPKWRYQGHQLARDQRGNYYYVDRLRDDYGGKGYRLWIGPRGRMKRIQMTNIVADSEGEIFATKKGELRLIANKDKYIWVRGKQQQDLVRVPVEQNVKLIYDELGVYMEELGTPCDHM